MFKTYLILSFLWILSSCATPLTQEGEQVSIVTASQKEAHCEFIDIVTANGASAWNNGGEQLDEAMRVLRNKVGEIGGNAMILMQTTQNLTLVQAEALYCKPGSIQKRAVRKITRTCSSGNTNCCMSNSDCSEGKTCATVKGEYPGQCVGKW